MWQANIAQLIIYIGKFACLYPSLWWFTAITTIWVRQFAVDIKILSGQKRLSRAYPRFLRFAASTSLLFCRPLRGRRNGLKLGEGSQRTRVPWPKELFSPLQQKTHLFSLSFDLKPGTLPDRSADALSPKITKPVKSWGVAGKQMETR